MILNWYRKTIVVHQNINIVRRKLPMPKSKPKFEKSQMSLTTFMNRIRLTSTNTWTTFHQSNRSSKDINTFVFFQQKKIHNGNTHSRGFTQSASRLTKKKKKACVCVSFANSSKSVKVMAACGRAARLPLLRPFRAFAGRVVSGGW